MLCLLVNSKGFSLLSRLGFLYHGYAFSIIDRARGYLLGKGQIQRREEPLHLKRDQNPALSGILTAPPLP